MFQTRSVMKIFFASLLFASCFARAAYAYLDPGTGSYFLQFLIAAIVGSMFAIKMFWNRIKAFVKQLFSREKKHERPKE